MRLVGVLDVKGGQVVRGQAGRRETYRPLISPLCHSADPQTVAVALQRRYGLRDFYLADLDAIAGAEPAWAIYRSVSEAVRGTGEQRAELWVDAGVRTATRARNLAANGVDRIVVGLETVAGPEVLAELVVELGERLVFSLDLKDGQPLGLLTGWPSTEPLAIAEQAIALGVRRLLLLDLARVGMATGTGTEEMCRWLAQAHPHLYLAVGGGVRDEADLLRLQACGASAVLVASALHEGRLAQARHS